MAPRISPIGAWAISSMPSSPPPPFRQQPILTIRRLPETVVNRIAAGEVVERPASAVKELVENALDAGARGIRVALSGGGLELVSVADDGCGMSREDAVMSLGRHATSKLRDLDGLFCIRTLGFRGE